MKTIDPSHSTTKKTLCPFCSFGCEFGLVFNDFGIKGVEYLKEGSSGGRLCPRGSAAALFVDHPKRLSMPIKDGTTIQWTKIIKDLKKAVDKPENVGVTFDRNITTEEYEAITAFCRSVGIEHTASTYFEPEALLGKFMEKPFTLDDISASEMIIVVGDPFNQAPMTSKSLIDWKLNMKGNRLVVIDSIRTHTAHFASDFCQVTAGTEALLLLGLAGKTVDGVDYARLTGVAKSTIREISESFKQAKHGIIVVCLTFAHSFDPLLLVEGLLRLQESSGKKVVPFVEFAGFHGNEHFGSIIESVKKKKIKHLLNFGELFPYSYPQLVRALKGVNVCATSPLKQSGYTTLPVALNLEKQGSVLTTFGRKTLYGITPASGARTVNEILDFIAKGTKQTEPFAVPPIEVDVKTQAQALAQRAHVSKKKKTFMLMGEKIAYNFLGLLENPMLKLHPVDARKLGLQQNDEVTIKSKHGQVVLKAKLTEDTVQGVVVVPAENPDVKGIFDFDVNNKVVCFIPTEVQLWRKE